MTVDKLQVKIYDTRVLMGEAAARDTGERLKELLALQPEVNMVFAAAPSQNEYLDALTALEGIAWGRVNAFHMDEYVGLPGAAPQRFAHFLRQRLFAKLPFAQVHYLDTTADPLTECERYAALLRRFPPDIACLGIGENGHLAFNDPHVADFLDPRLVKPVELDLVSRWQQVHDGCFERLEQVPEQAVTLTMPALLQAKAIFCIVPGAHKAGAVWHTLHSSVGAAHPSTALRRHPGAMLYLDRDSAAQL